MPPRSNDTASTIRKIRDINVQIERLRAADGEEARAELARISQQLVDLQLELLEEKTDAALPPVPPPPPPDATNALPAPPPVPEPPAHLAVPRAPRLGAQSAETQPMAVPIPPPPAPEPPPADDFPAPDIPDAGDAAADAGNIPAASAAPAAAVLVPPRPGPIRRFVNRFGAEGFMFSMLFHLALLLIALLYVTTRYLITEKEPDTFATGAGGGQQGERVRQNTHRVRAPAMRSPRNAPRISVAGGTNSLAMPQMPDLAPGLLGEGVTAGALSKGMGGGGGGGVGTGLGIGVGNKRNFVSRFIFGRKVAAKRIAVYVDASGSMEPHLKRVRAEVKKQFPDADIFECFGVGITVTGGKVTMGRAFSTKNWHDFAKAKFADKFMVYQYYYNEPWRLRVREALSAQGQEIYDRHWPQFHLGQVGAWLDIMLFEKYDALIVFADFEDGVGQTRYPNANVYNRWYGDAGSRMSHSIKEKPGELGAPWIDAPVKDPLAEKEGDPYPIIWHPSWGAWAGGGHLRSWVYNERANGSAFYDFRSENERAWEREWLTRCADPDEGPRIYLFSIQHYPQSIWRRCVKASDGAINMMPELGGGTKSGTQPVRKPPTRPSRTSR